MSWVLIIALGGAIFAFLNNFDNDKSCMLTAKAVAFRTAGVKMDFVGCCTLENGDCKALIGPKDFALKKKDPNDLKPGPEPEPKENDNGQDG